ncbi:antibiotic biosynthesis monooxygenase [Haloferax sp. S1W]|uniref:antibiotic biosynthesis monooxygenase n=1 Tax=Haloferax sp. S1W TaxID=3377110 RepID=UPI0037CABE8E
MAYLHVKATVDDYDDWKSSFEEYHSKRAEFGGKSYQLYQATDNPNEIVVVIEFDSEENAREWSAYLEDEEELTEPDVADIELTYLDLVEQKQLSAV